MVRVLTHLRITVCLHCFAALVHLHNAPARFEYNCMQLTAITQLASGAGLEGKHKCVTCELTGAVAQPLPTHCSRCPTNRRQCHPHAATMHRRNFTFIVALPLAQQRSNGNGALRNTSLKRSLISKITDRILTESERKLNPVIKSENITRFIKKESLNLETINNVIE